MWAWAVSVAQDTHEGVIATPKLQRADVRVMGRCPSRWQDIEAFLRPDRIRMALRSFGLDLDSQGYILQAFKEYHPGGALDRMTL